MTIPQSPAAQVRPAGAHTGSPAIALDEVTVRYPGGGASAASGGRRGGRGPEARGAGGGPRGGGARGGGRGHTGAASGSGAGLFAIDLQVEDGEFLAIVGPSGSGKTTLLRTVAGFIVPQEGTVTIGGRAVAGPAGFVPPEGRGLGMVFQDHAVWPHMSVGRNIEHPLRLAKVPAAERRARVEAVLDTVGLPGFAGRRPASLSGGQRQRVALARAVVAGPRALLLDEALSSLDEPLRARLRSELRALTVRDGLTALHVTHDRAEALAIADRVAVLDHGRIAQIGTPRELLDAPASPFVAQFLQDARVFDARVDGAEVRVRLGGGDAAGGDAVPEVRVPLERFTRHAGRADAGSSMPTRSIVEGTTAGDSAHDGSDSARPAGGGTTAKLALGPGDLELVPAGASAAFTGTVEAVLFGSEAWTVEVECGGEVFHLRHRGDRPIEGETVGIAVRSGHLYG